MTATHSIHHVTVFAARTDRLLQVFEEILAFPRVARMDVDLAQVGVTFGKPDLSGSTTATLLGGGRVGLVEIVEAPWIDPTVTPPAGIVQVSVPVSGIVEVLDQLVAAGCSQVCSPVVVEGLGTRALVGTVDVDGMRIQVVAPEELA